MYMLYLYQYLEWGDAIHWRNFGLRSRCSTQRVKNTAFLISIHPVDSSSVVCASFVGISIAVM